MLVLCVFLFLTAACLFSFFLINTSVDVSYNRIKLSGRGAHEFLFFFLPERVALFAKRGFFAKRLPGNIAQR